MEWYYIVEHIEDPDRSRLALAPNFYLLVSTFVENMSNIMLVILCLLSVYFLIQLKLYSLFSRLFQLCVASTGVGCLSSGFPPEHPNPHYANGG